MSYPGLQLTAGTKDEMGKALTLGTKFQGVPRHSETKINDILMQYLRKSKLMPKIHDE